MEAESWWGDLDNALLHCIAEGAMDPAEIGRHLGISAAGVTSLLLLLAHQGEIRIRLVGGPIGDALVRSFHCPSRDEKVAAEFSRDSGQRVTRVNWCSSSMAWRPSASPTSRAASRPDRSIRTAR